MENGANTLNGFKTFLLWDVRLWKYHHEMKFMSLDHGVMPFLEHLLVTISFMIFHVGVVVYVDVTIEGQGFEYTNPRRDKYI